MKKTVLVTGTSGFIGGRLAQRLMETGVQVRCSYRREKLTPVLESLRDSGAELQRGNLSDETYLEQLLDGISAVYHVAGKSSDWGSLESFRDANALAVDKLFKAAKKAGATRAVHLSSLSVHGFGPHKDSTEEGPYYRHINPYQISKKEGEDIALAANEPGFHLSVIRPGNVYGPQDTTTSFPIFEAMEAGKMGFLSKGAALTCPVYVDDLIDAILAAGEVPEAAGEVFNITGDELITWKELITLNAGALDLPVPKLNVPGALAMAVAHIMSGTAKLLRLKNSPPLTPYRVAQLTDDYHFSMEKARRILGYNPKVTYSEGVVKTAASYRSR